MIDTSTYRPLFQKALDHVSREISHLRTGKASAQMLDTVIVDAYGSQMHVNEVGNISVPDTTLIVVTPWDKSLLPAIEKAIQSSQLNLNPIVDGELIRIPVPPLTQERRQEMVKILQQKLEEGKVMLRNIRADVKKDIEGQEGEPGISEDDISAELDTLQDVTQDFIDQVEKLGELKEKELLSL